MATASTTTAPALPKEIFKDVPEHHELLKAAYVAEAANQRQTLAATKQRGQVRGGGRKPWRQKGTGRARVGSTRSPLWRSGGVIFGPSTDRNFSKKLNQKARATALRQALSLKAEQKAVISVADFEIASGKTKDAASAIAKLSDKRRILLVTDTLTVDSKRALRNLPAVHTAAAANLSTRPVMDADVVIITKAAIAVLQTRLAGGKTS